MTKIYRRYNEELSTQSIKLDKRDIKILTILAKNAKTPLSKIAKVVNLSRDSINYRIKKMEKKGFILKFIPIINTKAFGYDTYHIFLLLEEGKNERRTKLINELKKSEYVKSVMEYSDRWDLEIVLIAKDIEELDNIKEDLFNKYIDIITERSTLETVKVFTSNFFPIKFYDTSFSLSKKGYGKEGKYDEKDILILKEISENCRKSTYEIGKNLNLSPDTVGIRLKNLEKEKIIEKYTIVVNLNMLNFHWYTFAMNISAIDKKTELKLKTYVSNNRNIIRASKMLGSYDIILYLLSDSSKGFHKTIKEIKSEFSEITKSYESWIAYKEHYFDPFPCVIFNS